MKTHRKIWKKPWLAMFILRSALVVAVFGCGVDRARATGDFGASEYLVGAGSNAAATPEFYWELEMKRLAGDFHPPEKPMVVIHGLDDPAPLQKATADADLGDFSDALKTGAIKPGDAALATRQDVDARNRIAALIPPVPALADDGSSVAPPATNAPATNAPPTAPVPTALGAEFDSEFADYHRGAFAFRLGQEHWAEAQAAWEGLLKRPAAERHYRSVWAAFMLGKLALKRGDKEASKWFEQTRDLAKAGFADSLGMAADSYGWEGRGEWKQGHPEKAAPLFLNQLALGDESAVVSLKALVPDREPVDGTLNYDGKDPNAPDATPAPDPAAQAKVLTALEFAAADPLLRRVVTAHILATETAGSRYNSSPGAVSVRGKRWLDAVAKTKSDPVEDAEYLGWLAYANGDYEQAESWLKKAQGDTVIAAWLRAKLQLRAGKLEDAERNMARAVELFRDPSKYTGWSAGAYQMQNDGFYDHDDTQGWSPTESSSGDLGIVRLARNDFIQAFDVLFKGGLWQDASFVGERVLTLDELKAYVDKLPIPPVATAPASDEAALRLGSPAPGDEVARLRNLLGRRLVREDRYDEAQHYLPAPYDKMVKKYAQALEDGANEKLPKLQRAKAWFTAAWQARYDGMELMGTEVAPDAFVFDGDFQSTDLAQQFLTGRYTVTNWDSGDVKQETSKSFLAISPEEKKRLETNVIEPDERWHYRYISAHLAMRAATLMETNTEELADVVNRAGLWMKDLDEKTADGYYNVIEQRCAKTKFGGKVLAQHWFVDEDGPWSALARADDDAMQPKK